ncbi:MAG: twin-arginine translocase subunit TatC [Candidatus Dormibacteraeota bacterium]|nr:twin-arginine translocase subunit TatC [Candidatus Dormibacteraeota bacterium]
MALLSRSASSRPKTAGDTRMSIIAHLEDLRRALIISIIGWLLVTLVAFFFSGQVFQFLVERSGVHQVYFTAPTDPFTLKLKVSLYLGLVVASPIIFQQLWWFVSPGLHLKEKRLILPLIIATTFFFLLGVGFALFALPLIIHVLFGFQFQGLAPLITASELLSFVLGIVIAFGVVFELPVVLYTLGLLRIISSRWLWKHRAYWLVALGLIANVMTPGADPFTPLIVFVPLAIFWLGTTLLLRLTGR